MIAGYAGAREINCIMNSSANRHQALLCQGCDWTKALENGMVFLRKTNEIRGITMRRAIGYCRVSTDDQVREGVSLDNQREKIRAYILLKDLQLVEIIEDAGLSAKNLRRPGMQRVLDLARKKEIDAVVVYKLDRMFRSTIDALEVTRGLDKQGIEFHSLQESLDTSSAMGRFFFTLTAALAEMERGITAERTTQALRHLKAQGRKTGGDIPFGFAGVDAEGKLIEDSEEQRVIGVVRGLRASGLSLREISRELHAMGYTTRRGMPFHPQTIARILGREVA